MALLISTIEFNELFNAFDPNNNDFKLFSSVSNSDSVIKSFVSPFSATL
jgi:hypothetical protein